MARVVGVLWHKVLQGLGDINNMPRSRRRHHSRSRSRSNSPDREPKRRKVVESFESPPHNRRSVSSEPEANEIENVDAQGAQHCDNTVNLDSDSSLLDKSNASEPGGGGGSTPNKTPLKNPLTPKQLQKRLESEKKKAEKQREKDERNLKKQQERDAKQKQRQIEKDAKEAKAREEREAKQLEKDAKEEVKRKEREKKESERLKKQAEVDEKNREKQKLEEKKQKAAAAFTKFFVPRKSTGEVKKEPPVQNNNNFMPFQLKSDMRLAPASRNTLNNEGKEHLEQKMSKQDQTPKEYLKNLKVNARSSGKTWLWTTDDVVLIENESNLNKNISNAKISVKLRAKFLKFHENRRPAYFGTWRKKSTKIKPRTPFGQDNKIINYEIDSDDEWEEEEEGEDIAGSDDEEKTPEEENDYEVDDEFFVPHGHLSDDEEDDQENITPEMRKAKEKLLKNQFDEERKLLTKRLKPRVIGCIWYGNNNNNEDGVVDHAIHTFLQPYKIISKGIVEIKKMVDFEDKKDKRKNKKKWQLDKQHMPDLLRLVHGNTQNKNMLCAMFYDHLERKKADVIVNKVGMIRLIKSVAKYSVCTQKGPMFKKRCWLVNDTTLDEYNLSLKMPNDWQRLKV